MNITRTLKVWAGVGHGDETARTQETFGLLWRQTATGRVRKHRGTHLERAAAAVGFDPVAAEPARMLDAGCGAGHDLRWAATQHPRSLVVGLEFNDATDVPAAVVRDLANAQVVRGSVLEPPFRPGTFDLVYSYGVLHHTRSSSEGFAALAPLVSPGGAMLIYVYTDLDEEPIMRALMKAVDIARKFTTRLDPKMLLKLARIGAPAVFLLFGVPASILRRVRRGRAVANWLPFNHVQGPFDATGDLFDRFSAPIEQRHSRAHVREWFEECSFRHIEVAAMQGARGWVGFGRMPRLPTA